MSLFDKFRRHGTAETPSGVQNPRTVDLVAEDSKTSSVILIMVESRPWGEKGALLLDLQAKIKSYLSFVSDGGLAKHYPDLKDKPIRFRLDMMYPLGPKERQFIKVMRSKWLEPEGIQWEEGVLSEKTST